MKNNIEETEQLLKNKYLVFTLCCVILILTSCTSESSQNRAMTDKEELANVLNVAKRHAEDAFNNYGKADAKLAGLYEGEENGWLEGVDAVEAGRAYDPGSSANYYYSPDYGFGVAPGEIVDLDKWLEDFGHADKFPEYNLTYEEAFEEAFCEAYRAVYGTAYHDAFLEGYEKGYNKW
ncbi:MAG: hypothetical protein LBN34_03245 [Clostridiales Family XIII bacterium]|nr:hypothetical protein [Clostridiales Family XIII bacterium]